MATIKLVDFLAEAKMVCGNVVVSLRRLATVVECCVDGDGLCMHWLATLLVHWMATAFVASDGDGCCMHRRAMLLVHWLATVSVAMDGDGFGCCVGWRRLSWASVATAFACVGWRRLLWHWMVMAFVCVGR